MFEEILNYLSHVFGKKVLEKNIFNLFSRTFTIVCLIISFHHFNSHVGTYNVNVEHGV